MSAAGPLPGLGAVAPDTRPLLARIGRAFRTGAHVTRVAFLGDTLAAALGDGTVRFVSPGAAAPLTVGIHDGAVLSAAPSGDGAALLTGGDDGRLALTLPDGTTRRLAEGGRWVDAVVGAGPHVAFARGRTVTILRDGVMVDEVTLPSSGPGLGVSADGKRLAIAHLDGATIVDLRSPGTRRRLVWKGAHIAATFSPDGRFLVTAMNENALHGWRLSDGADMAMRGYPAKPKSLSWSGDGLWLASSGADTAVVWPFRGKAGPMGQPADVVGRREVLLTAVACHPSTDIVATGFRDGCVEIVRRADDTALLVRPGTTPSAEAAVTDIAFDRTGRFLAFGTASGTLGLLDFAKAPS